jgi:hypothetical protein
VPVSKGGLAHDIEIDRSLFPVISSSRTRQRRLRTIGDLVPCPVTFARVADRAVGAAGHRVQPARCAGEPAIAGSMFRCAGRPGWFRDRMVMPDGLVRNRRRRIVKSDDSGR